MPYPTLTRRASIGVLAATALAVLVATQTRIVAPENRYPPDEDVRLGREAAAEVPKELPMLDDRRVGDYVARIGQTLTGAIPSEFSHPQFVYSFGVINQKEINAFALPGGPMFLNRGMIEAAGSEGEVAGVMAHEISHVALRHGTAQATAARKFQIIDFLGQLGGAIAGGTLGSIIATGTSFGAGTAFLKYSREYESQADLLGAQMLARAGYDPREMAEMFKTIEAQGGGRGPQWLSSHPNPANRYDAINQEARLLRIQGNAATGQFAGIKGYLSGMAPAFTAEQIARGEAKNSPSPAATAARPVVTVEPPDARLRRSRPLPFLRVSVPSNWAEVAGDDQGVTYAPTGGYLAQGGDLAGFTHGVQVGVVSARSADLGRETDLLVGSFRRSNPELRQQGDYQRETIGGRTGLRVTLSNVSSITGRQETVSLATVGLNNGRVLFIVGVAPTAESRTYDDVFRRIRQSAQINDR